MFGELHALLLPLGGHRKPIDAATFDDELGLQALGLEEQALERVIAKVFRMIRPVIPHAGEDVKKILVGVTNPQARLRRKPIELP